MGLVDRVWLTADRQSNRQLHQFELLSRVSGTKFFVYVSGRTNGAHHGIVDNLTSRKHTQVSSHEESDYLLVFCPIASRVGTDISEALENIPSGKPIILVVMHHTFNRDQIVAQSRRQVENGNVCLTVDCLFYERKLLQCERNNTAWGEIQDSLGLPRSVVLNSSDIMDRARTNLKPSFETFARFIVMIVMLFMAVLRPFVGFVTPYVRVLVKPFVPFVTPFVRPYVTHFANLIEKYKG